MSFQTFMTYFLLQKTHAHPKKKKKHTPVGWIKYKYCTMQLTLMLNKALRDFRKKSMWLSEHFPIVLNGLVKTNPILTLSLPTFLKKVASQLHFSVPPGFCDSAITEFIAKSSKLCNFRKSSHIFVIVADFGLRRVPWRHRNAHSVKERLFLSLKNGMNSLAFSSCPIYKSYTGQTNRKRNESALLVWATRRRPFICSGRSCGLLSITRHRYTQRWEIQWRK